MTIEFRAEMIEPCQVRQESIALPLRDLPWFARALGMQPRTLQRRLDQQGQPFGAILAAVRSRQAARYLANPRLSVTEVAELSGYASLSAFTRWHTKTLGMSPQRFRKQRRASS